MKPDNKKEPVEPVAVVVVAEPVTPLEKKYDPTEENPTKLEHFDIYNKHARLKKIPVKVPSEDFYPKMKVRFQRFEQPTNVLKCRVRNKDID
jgi:hypothetical protein